VTGAYAKAIAYFLIYVVFEKYLHDFTYKPFQLDGLRESSSKLQTNTEPGAYPGDGVLHHKLDPDVAPRSA
jgi:hypothetical protein